jgi:phosphatidylglycerophosphate synthase
VSKAIKGTVSHLFGACSDLFGAYTNMFIQLENGTVVAIPTLIILAREIAVSALREWMAQRGQREIVKVGMQGKVKTALTMVALTVLLFVPSSMATDSPGHFFSSLYHPGIVLLYLCALVTVTSGSVYFMAAGRTLLEK